MGLTGKRFALASAIACVLSGAAPADAAYYWGYSPYSIGHYLFWPALNAFRPVLGPVHALTYGYGANPAYIASAGLRTAMYRGLRPRPYMTASQYFDDEPIGDPRKRVRAARPAETATDEIAHARWAKQAPAAMQVPGAYAPYAPAHPLAAPGPAMPAQPLPSSPANPAAAAGQAASLPLIASVPQPAAPFGQAQANMPFAQGFIDLVNGRFNGDIREALLDPEARSWARSIGLIDGDAILGANLSEERVGLIQKVMNDTSSPPHARLETVRMLIKH